MELVWKKKEKRCREMRESVQQTDENGEGGSFRPHVIVGRGHKAHHDAHRRGDFERNQEEGRGFADG